MKKITKIFFIVLILSIIGCHTPPSRESQDKDFFSFDKVINTSDRILKLSRNGNQISFIVDDISYTSFQFKVLKKIKGSSKKDDLIVVNSDNPKILEIAKALDVFPIKRPKNISGDKSSTEETIFHTLKKVEQLLDK